MNSEAKVLIATVAIGTGVLGWVLTEKYRTTCRELAAELKKLELEVNYPDSYWKAKENEDRLISEVKKAKIESNERLRHEELEQKKIENERRMEFEKSAPESYWKAKEAEARANADVKIQQERSRANLEMIRHENELLNEYGKRAEKIVKNSLSNFSDYYPYDYLFK